jgi:hypothetical protein
MFAGMEVNDLLGVPDTARELGLSPARVRDFRPVGCGEPSIRAGRHPGQGRARGAQFMRHVKNGEPPQARPRLRA